MLGSPLKQQFENQTHACKISSCIFILISDEDANEDFDLLEGHLIPHLERNLFNEINLLKSSSASQILTNFFQETRDLFNSFENDGSEFFLVYPIVQQYTNMVEYFLEKLLHLHRTSCKVLFVLAGIFTELATEVCRMKNSLVDQNDI